MEYEEMREIVNKVMDKTTELERIYKNYYWVSDKLTRIQTDGFEKKDEIVEELYIESGSFTYEKIEISPTLRRDLLESSMSVSKDKFEKCYKELCELFKMEKF
jgi:hypothetical protein